MSDVIKTIKGKAVEFGASKQLYHYVIYDYVKFKTVSNRAKQSWHKPET